jgi:hypothetical protein
LIKWLWDGEMIGGVAAEEEEGIFFIDLVFNFSLHEEEILF